MSLALGGVVWKEKRLCSVFGALSESVLSALPVEKAILKSVLLFFAGWAGLIPPKGLN